MPELPTVADPSAGALTLRELAEAAAEYAQNDKAENTRRGYAADIRHFEAWTAAAGVPGLPTSGDVLALYLTATAKAGSASVATMSHRIAAIRAAHKAAGWPMPDSGELSRAWNGIRRAHGRPAAAKSPMLLEDLRRVLDALPDTLAGKRDRALLLIGWGGALRRSELAAAQLPGSGGPVTLVMVRDGLDIHIDRAKGDQEGRGAVVSVTLGKEPTTCAQAALRAWLTASGIKEGPVFRRITKSGKIGDKALTPAVVSLIVKAAAERVGLDPAIFASHSLRSGLLTSSAMNGAAPDVLMNHARHQRYDTTRKYIKSAQRFTRNAAKIAGL